MGATNEPWSLAPAVMRPGRLDEKVSVLLPVLAARRCLMELSLRQRPLAPDIAFDPLAQRLEGDSGGDIVNICANACSIPLMELVKTGNVPDVAWQDFEMVCTVIKPSVEKNDLPGMRMEGG